MNLSNYFLADLPAGATLNATMISEACHALKRNRDKYLAGRPTQSLVATLSDGRARAVIVLAEEIENPGEDRILRRQSLPIVDE